MRREGKRREEKRREEKRGLELHASKLLWREEARRIGIGVWCGVVW